MKFLLVFILLSCPGLFFAQQAILKQESFYPAKVWKDQNNIPINAHGGGVLFFKGKYYWYGEHKLEGKSEKTFADGGIHCYSSADLIHWKDEGIVLGVDYKNEKSDLAYGCILERPKVVYNKKNKQFVAFFKLYLKGLGYETSNVGVAISDKPAGPFIYHHKFQGGGSVKGSGDFSMFTDDDGSLYHLTVRKPDKVFVIGKLNSDYYYPETEYKTCEGIELHTEAPVVIKRNGKYHLLGSGSSGWKPNAARYYSSSNIMGNWSFHGNPCIGTNSLDSMGSDLTYGGQSSYIFPIEGKKDAYIAMFDIWQPENPISGRYAWLPIAFNNHQMMIKWQDSWDMKFFENNTEDVIGASQTGASSLFFNSSDYAAPVIQTNHFSHPDEFNIRSGLPNFFNKAKKGQALTIGYLGGSITRANNQYRLQSAKYLQQLFPAVKMTGINAGVSGTGTDLGACRLYDQVLKHHPDLIFVEFAVNGAFPDGMEGIVRQIWKYNPRIDICFVYTIGQGQTKFYADGKIPDQIQQLEKIANHYAIPSVHMGLQAALLEQQQQLVWKADPAVVKDKLVFSADGTHPLESGGNLYAEAIARAMFSMKNIAKSQIHSLPNPLITDNWEDAKMLDPRSVASFSPEWEAVDPKTDTSLKQFSGWFPYLMKAEKPGASIRFQFEGTMIGFFDIGGPEVGQIVLELDGKKMHLKESSPINFIALSDGSEPMFINRFNKFCNNRYRGQCFFIKTPPGKHQVIFTIDSKIQDKQQILGLSQLEDISINPMKYNRSVIYLGEILIRGTVKASDQQ